MAKKNNHPKPVKQQISGQVPAKEHNNGQDKDIAGSDKKPKDKKSAYSKGTRSQGVKKKNKRKKKKEFNAAEAEKLAASGISLYS